MQVMGKKKNVDNSAYRAHFLKSSVGLVKRIGLAYRKKRKMECPTGCTCYESFSLCETGCESIFPSGYLCYSEVPDGKLVPKEDG